MKHEKKLRYVFLQNVKTRVAITFVKLKKASFKFFIRLSLTEWEMMQEK